MERYETEEQQVEAIKRFWKENGMAIILGAVIGLGGLWGWRYYNQSTLTGQEIASTEYQQTLENLISEQGIDNAKSFIAEHKDSGYASLAGLIVAQQQVNEGDIDAALEQLKQTVSLAKSVAVADLARLRLARVQIQAKQAQQAIITLEAIVNKSFAAQVDELKGDAYLAMANYDKAQTAYASALENDEGNVELEMKLSDIAYVAAASVTGENSEE